MRLTTLVVLSARRDGLDPVYGVDPMLASLGRQLGKQVVSLESAALQSALLKRVISGGSQGLDTLLTSLEQDSARPLLLRTARAWEDSAVEELEHYGQWCECTRTAEEKAQIRALLDERNPAMARQIARLHAQGQRVLAAVGSLHLFGEQGLPNLMREQGFQLHRLLPATLTSAQREGLIPPPEPQRK
jgi:uncharacterized protein YbaP (TraB family)